MEAHLLNLLQTSLGMARAELEIVRRDEKAQHSMAGDVLADMERRGHREFSAFTGRQGRP